MMFRQHIAVTTLLANLCVAVITEWALPELRWLAGITAWLAVVLLWATVKHHQKWLCAGLLSAGLAATFVGAVGNATVDWRSLLAGHSLLLAMLTGLAFVRPTRKRAGRHGCFSGNHKYSIRRIKKFLLYG